MTSAQAPRRSITFPACLPSAGRPFRARRLGPLCFPSDWNDRDFLAEGVHNQEPRYIVHRLLGLALWRILSLPQVVKDEQVRLEFLKSTVGDPRVELSRAFLEGVVLDAPLLDVVHIHAPIIQPRFLESWL